jgi:hypothetical protein
MLRFFVASPVWSSALFGGAPMQQAKSISVSKWLKHYVLLDGPEMEKLFENLEVHFFDVSRLTTAENSRFSKEQFLTSYNAFIAALKTGQIGPLPLEFSAALSNSLEAIYTHEVLPGKYMAKPQSPVIQLQPHRFFHSKIQNTIHSQVMGPESIFWGLQIAYPQICLSEGSYTKVQNNFPNTALFTQIAKWLRHHTVPTTFLFEGKKIATPLRLGKESFAWVHLHPQLLTQGLAVHVY